MCNSQNEKSTDLMNIFKGKNYDILFQIRTFYGNKVLSYLHWLYDFKSYQ